MALVMPLFGRLFDRGDYAVAYALATSAPILGWAIRRAVLGARAEGRLSYDSP
jgi:hypothetical protein